RELHLDPYRHLPAVLLWIWYRRSRISMVLAPGARRTARSRAVLYGTSGQVSGSRFGLQLVQAIRQPHCRLVIGLVDAYRLNRHALGGGIGVAAEYAASVEWLSVDW